MHGARVSLWSVTAPAGQLVTSRPFLLMYHAWTAARQVGSKKHIYDLVSLWARSKFLRSRVTKDRFSTLRCPYYYSLLHHLAADIFNSPPLPFIAVDLIRVLFCEDSLTKGANFYIYTKTQQSLQSKQSKQWKIIDPPMSSFGLPAAPRPPGDWSRRWRPSALQSARSRTRLARHRQTFYQYLETAR